MSLVASLVVAWTEADNHVSCLDSFDFHSFDSHDVQGTRNDAILKCNRINRDEKLNIFVLSFLTGTTATMNYYTFTLLKSGCRNDTKTHTVKHVGIYIKFNNSILRDKMELPICRATDVNSILHNHIYACTHTHILYICLYICMAWQTEYKLWAYTDRHIYAHISQYTCKLTYIPYL